MVGFKKTTLTRQSMTVAAVLLKLCDAFGCVSVCVNAVSVSVPSEC